MDRISFNFKSDSSSEVIESQFFGKSTGTEKTLRVAFQGLEDQKYWVVARQKAPGFFDRFRFIKLTINNQSLWVNERSLKKRLSTTYQGMQVLNTLLPGQVAPIQKHLNKVSDLIRKSGLNLNNNDPNDLNDLNDLSEAFLPEALLKFRKLLANPSLNSTVCGTSSMLKFQDRCLLVLTNQFLGEGTFKKVNKALDLQTGKIYAAASVRIGDQGHHDSQELTAAKAEVLFMKQFQGQPFFAQFIDEVKTEELYYMLMDYYTNGDLLDAITQNRLNEAQKKQAARDLLQGLKTLKDKHIFHRDIKLDNIFLDQENRAKIGDFGTAIGEHTPLQILDRFNGTAAYFSPEKSIAFNNPYDDHPFDQYACDAWAMGVVLLALFCPDSNLLTQISKIEKSWDQIRWISSLIQSEMDTWIQEAPADIQPVLKGLLQVDPKERIGPEEALQLLVN